MFSKSPLARFSRLFFPTFICIGDQQLSRVWRGQKKIKTCTDCTVWQSVQRHTIHNNIFHVTKWQLTYVLTSLPTRRSKMALATVALIGASCIVAGWCGGVAFMCFICAFVDIYNAATETNPIIFSSADIFQGRTPSLHKYDSLSL